MDHYKYLKNAKKKTFTDESSVKVKKVGEFVLKSILAICVKKLNYILIILRQADNNNHIKEMFYKCVVDLKRI